RGQDTSIAPKSAIIVPPQYKEFTSASLSVNDTRGRKKGSGVEFRYLKSEFDSRPLWFPGLNRRRKKTRPFSRCRRGAKLKGLGKDLSLSLAMGGCRVGKITKLGYCGRVLSDTGHLVRVGSLGRNGLGELSNAILSGTLQRNQSPSNAFCRVFANALQS